MRWIMSALALIAATGTANGLCTTSRGVARGTLDVDCEGGSGAHLDVGRGGTSRGTLLPGPFDDPTNPRSIEVTPRGGGGYDVYVSPPLFPSGRSRRRPVDDLD